MGTEVKIPDIGTFKNVPIIELLVQVGDRIALDQPLITLESDKATLEVPAPVAGVVEQLYIKLGDRVSQGSLLLLMATEETLPATAVDTAAVSLAVPVMAPVAPVLPTAAEEVAPVNPEPRSAIPVMTEAAQLALTVAHASPTVRRYARELGVDLGQVKGSGPKTRILREDVQHFVQQALTHPVVGQVEGWMGLPPWPEMDFAQWGDIAEQPLTRIQKLSGAYLHRNWVRIPHVTNHEEADITELEAFRQQLNQEAPTGAAHVTLLTLVLKALAALLPSFPEFNASLQGDTLILKRYIHLGFAADTPQGLLVPVVRDVPSLGIRQLASRVADLAAQAREGKLAPEAMQGGTFSVSSLGGVGGSFFTPIINAPELAILGLGRAQQKPVWHQGTVAPRWLLPLSLSYDHRVIDGAHAARFNEALRQMLVDLRRVLL